MIGAIRVVRKVTTSPRSADDPECLSDVWKTFIRPAAGTFEDAQPSGSPAVQFSKPALGIWAFAIIAIPISKRLKESNFFFMVLIDLRFSFRC
jgi:hypothetical protein